MSTYTKNTYTFSLLFFFLTLILLTNIPNTYAENGTDISTSELKKKIEIINNELAALSKIEQEAKGNDKLALQLQSYEKNNQLRELIDHYFSVKNINKKFISNEINKQVTFINRGLNFLSSSVASLSEKLNKAKNDDKFSILSQYEEAWSFLDLMYKDLLQNFQWKQKLGEITEREKNAFVKRINVKMEILAAKVNFLEHQYSVETGQLKITPKSDKNPVELQVVITKRKLEIATTSLNIIINIADDIGISTAEYKRLYLETTGNITEYIFNFDVMGSIFKSWSNKILHWLIVDSPQHVLNLIVFITILLIAKLLSTFVRFLVKRAVLSKNLDFTHLMQDFFVSISGKVVMVIGFLVGLSQFGIDLTPILTGFGIAGVIVGFALQDSLSNFASGMMLLIYRPFDVGDFVSAGGVEGKVNHMSLVNTTIRTFDNQVIMVPNSKIWTNVIKNVTHERVRRVDMKFGIAYHEDVERVESIFLDIVTSHPAVLKAPEPMIKLHELSDSSVNYIVRPWVKTDDYYDVYWDVTREVKIRLQKEGVSIPFPQRDLHVFMQESDKQTLKKNI